MLFKVLSKFLKSLALSLVALLSACSTTSVHPRSQAPSGVSSLGLPEPAAPQIGSPINVLAAVSYLEREGINFVRQGRVNTNLLAQAPPRICRLHLPPAGPDILLRLSCFRERSGALLSWVNS